MQGTASKESHGLQRYHLHSEQPLVIHLLVDFHVVALSRISSHRYGPPSGFKGGPAQQPLTSPPDRGRASSKRSYILTLRCYYHHPSHDSREKNREIAVVKVVLYKPESRGQLQLLLFYT